MRGLRKLPLRVLAGGGLAWLLLTLTPLVPWWAQWLSSAYSDQTRPILIVLSGDPAEDGVIGYSTYLRCVYAFWFWQKYDPQEIVLSGGPSNRPVAATMAAFLVSLGVPRERLRLETASTDTRQNLTNVARMLPAEKRPLTLLTSDFHMRRSLLLARRAGLTDIAPHPVPDAIKRALANRWERPGLALLLATETAKLGWETIRR